jgi:membrane protein implicated in regulation of membrane protease activity
MRIAKTFLDHLFFSLVSVLVGLIALHVALAAIYTDFSLFRHTWLALVLWLGSSVALASVFAACAIRKRPTDQIELTHR